VTGILSAARKAELVKHERIVMRKIFTQLLAALLAALLANL